MKEIYVVGFAFANLKLCNEKQLLTCNCKPKLQTWLRTKKILLCPPLAKHILTQQTKRCQAKAEAEGTVWKTSRQVCSLSG